MFSAVSWASDLAEQKHANACFSGMPFLYSLVPQGPILRKHNGLSALPMLLSEKLRFAVVLFLSQWLMCARLALNSLCG